MMPTFEIITTFFCLIKFATICFPAMLTEELNPLKLVNRFSNLLRFLDTNFRRFPGMNRQDQVKYPLTLT